MSHQLIWLGLDIYLGLIGLCDCEPPAELVGFRYLPLPYRSLWLWATSWASWCGPVFFYVWLYLDRLRYLPWPYRSLWLWATSWASWCGPVFCYVWLYLDRFRYLPWSYRSLWLWATSWASWCGPVFFYPLLGCVWWLDISLTFTTVCRTASSCCNWAVEIEDLRWMIIQ